MLRHNGFQPTPIDMRVDLGCRDIRMSKQFLDDAKIRTACKEMSREGVTQHVRMDVRQTGAFSQPSDDLPHSDTFQWPTRIAEKQPLIITSVRESSQLRVQRFQIVSHGISGRFSDWHQSFTVAFAMYEDDAERLLVFMQTD